MSMNHGSGPGEITPDGCSVEFYSLLPVMGEPSIVHGAVPAGASISTTTNWRRILLPRSCASADGSPPASVRGYRAWGVNGPVNGPVSGTTATKT